MINYPNLLIDIVLLYLFKITMHLVDFYGHANKKRNYSSFSSKSELSALIAFNSNSLLASSAFILSI